MQSKEKPHLKTQDACQYFQSNVISNHFVLFECEIHISSFVSFHLNYKNYKNNQTLTDMDGTQVKK